MKETTIHKNRANVAKYGHLVDNVIYGEKTKDEQVINSKFNK